MVSITRFVEQATATWLKDATGNTPFYADLPATRPATGSGAAVQEGQGDFMG